MLAALRDYSFPLLLALALHATAVWLLYRGWHPEREVSLVVQPKMVMANLIVLEPKAKPKRVAPPPETRPAQPEIRESKPEEPKPDPAELRRKEAEDRAAKEAAERARAEAQSEERGARLALDQRELRKVERLKTAGLHANREGDFASACRLFHQACLLAPAHAFSHFTPPRATSHFLAPSLPSSTLLNPSKPS